MWDREVDVVCCGLGLGAAAVALAAADAGLDVHLVRPGPSHDGSGSPARAARWIDPSIEDPDTREYLDELAADVDPTAAAGSETDLPVRSVSAWTPVTGRGRIAPFYGSRLRDWTQSCLLSPYGVLYTRLSDRETVSMKSRSGEEIQVKTVGMLDVDGAADSAAAVAQWMTAQLAQRDLRVSTDSSLRRLVFEEGEVVGVVADTPAGPLTLRARHGVAISTGPIGDGRAAPTGQLTELGKPMQVGLVGHSASRFGRLELLHIEKDVPQPVSQRPDRAEGRREQKNSRAGRRRKVNGHPPLGQ